MTIALPDTIAVVTGAAGGIGRELCKALKAAGATVIATDLAASATDLTADHYLQHDVTDAAAWQRVADFVATTYGRLDALVNNAGFSIVVKFEDSPLSEWQRVQSINVDSMVIGIQAMLPMLKEGGKARKGGASVVNFSSVGGKNGAAFNAAYCTSKAAVGMLTKCLGIEFAALGYNIRVNSVHPGGIETAMLNSILNRYVEIGAVPSLDVALEGVNRSHPIGRMGRPDELGGGVVYLCSEAASFVTSSELVIDGGFTAI
ncbi:SDR family NAD(P)-dependent oxidoreductase [Aquisediminimonas sediminicola]|uniref:SDR family NAD(P)-dependent oxidoreductase n=1 Tax=Alteraquisediminimonas sediminicola TaxID=2676787 RepID=UPI001C8E2627|nr:SDR family oxidoreductase [Aquisediminimonas sediminicola]